VVSRKPSRAALPHAITLWNWTGKGEVVNGAKVRQYNKVYVKYMRCDETNSLAGTVNLGNLYFEIYNGVSEVRNPDGALCTYVPPHVYLNAPENKQKTLWTLNMDDDFFGIGVIADENPSTGGERNRKDYIINNVDAKTGFDGSVHHWEVYGR